MSPSNVKHRKSTSDVRNYFEKVNTDSLDDKGKARCKNWGCKYISGSSHGTSNRRCHQKTCLKRKTRDGQAILSQTPGSGAVEVSRVNCDKSFIREFMAIHIVENRFPLDFFELPGVRNLFSYLIPGFMQIPKTFVKNDIIELYSKEKRKVEELLDSTTGRISVTLNMWTSITTEQYMCINAHFFDKEWKLHKKMLNFRLVPPPYTGVAFSEIILDLFADWKVENKLFSLTLDDCAVNDVLVESLKTHLNSKKTILLEGQFFHIRFLTYILADMVQDALKEIDGSVQKIRVCMQRLKYSKPRKLKFMEFVKQLNITSKEDLHLDVLSQWDLTYRMLRSALEYKDAIYHMQSHSSEFDGPTQEEWSNVDRICKFLQVFSEVKTIFSETENPTSNLYLLGVWNIQLFLKEAAGSSDTFISTMAAQMQKKFDKYWKESYVLLAIAVILDPRYKLQFVEYCFLHLYGSDADYHISVVRKCLEALFNEYSKNLTKAPMSSLHVTGNEVGSGMVLSSDLSDYDAFLRQKSIHVNKSELELYLEERCSDLHEPLDILMFWQSAEYRYPNVALMARDVLTVPISTVAPEVICNVGRQMIDHYKNTLELKDVERVEALICTRDWLFGTKDENDYNADGNLDVGLYDIDSNDDED